VQALCALSGAEQMLTQAGVESRQMGQYLPGFRQLRWQAVEQFMLQIVEQGRRAPLFVFFARPLTSIE